MSAPGLAETGHLMAMLALAASAVQAWAGLTLRADAARRSASLAWALLGLAFLTLVVSFLRLDFSLDLVARNSHSQKPLIYRIAGTWGNHEGSMLLWCLIMAGFGGVAALVMTDSRLKSRALGVQGLLTLASLCFLLFASSPFARLDPAPLEGAGLNPLLQDPALALHPPFLYLGYVGMSFVFSLAAAGLMNGEIDSDWARRTRPWALAAWSGLTVGITLGSIWAYYELGWGGWWFWDPVENASFMPWLVGAALIHSLIVTQKRGSLAAWTAFLAVTTFCLSLLGAFLVRSGVLTSVHAFALDPERGALLLIGLALAGGGAFALYAWRAPKLSAGAPFDPVSREGALIVNNLFLSVSAAVVLFGTLVPLAVEAMSGETISVGPPFFELTLAPMLGVLFLLPPVAQAMALQRADLSPLFKRLAVAGALAAGAGGLAVLLLRPAFWPVFGVAVGVWVIAGAVADLWRRKGAGGLMRLFRLSGSVWGMTIAHVGVGLFVIGAVAEASGRVERTYALSPGEQVEFSGHVFTLESVRPVEGPNYYADEATIRMTRDGTSVLVTPQKRYYPVSGMPTTEVAIRRTGGGDMYVAMGEAVRDRPGRWTLRLSFHPLIDLVFGGALLIAVGGVFALVSRRRSSATVREPAPAPASELPAAAE